MHARPRPRVPYTESALASARHERAAVRRDDERVDPLRTRTQQADAAPVERRPDSDAAVVAARRDPLLVWCRGRVRESAALRRRRALRPRNIVDGLLVPAEHAHAPPDDLRAVRNTLTADASQPAARSVSSAGAAHAPPLPCPDPHALVGAAGRDPSLIFHNVLFACRRRRASDRERAGTVALARRWVYAPRCGGRACAGRRLRADDGGVRERRRP
mmetsp:Transcript_41194/g.95032  ORF Transcript_41194/g.95032 Transcript_41194/m.95032 type:complete len:216 (-) Transcript_41194:1952-2599(-)